MMPWDEIKSLYIKESRNIPRILMLLNTVHITFTFFITNIARKASGNWTRSCISTSSRFEATTVAILLTSSVIRPKAAVPRRDPAKKADWVRDGLQASEQTQSI